jgi:hypothetical protein
LSKIQCTGIKYNVPIIANNVKDLIPHNQQNGIKAIKPHKALRTCKGRGYPKKPSPAAIVECFSAS